MSSREHAATASLLQRYFNLPNGNNVWNPVIDVYGDAFHFSPAGNGVKIAADAKLWRQGMAPQKWEFGTVQKCSNIPTGCVALGNPAYQVTIPISDLFYDPQIPGVYTPLVTFPHPAFMYGNFTIDLYNIQQKVLENQ
ncbi:unnamed protein product [Rhizophagus irregularis]|nr:unnamed protein product [Rhizophagus irregularis]